MRNAVFLPKRLRLIAHGLINRFPAAAQPKLRSIGRKLSTKIARPTQVTGKSRSLQAAVQAHVADEAPSKGPLSRRLVPIGWLSALRIIAAKRDCAIISEELHSALVSAEPSQRPFMLEAATNFLSPRVLSAAAHSFKETTKDVRTLHAIAQASLDVGDLSTASRELALTASIARGTAGSHQLVLSAQLALYAGEQISSRVFLQTLLNLNHQTVNQLARSLDVAEDLGDAELVKLIQQRLAKFQNGKDGLAAGRRIYESGGHGLGMAMLAGLLNDSQVSHLAAFWIAHYLRNSGQLFEAKVILETLLRLDHRPDKVRLELAEIAVEQGNLETATELADKATSDGKTAAFSSARFAAKFSKRDYAKAFSEYTSRGTLQPFRDGVAGSNYTGDYKSWSKATKRLLLASSGVGDEIRWASTYRRLPQDGSTYVTCDPRLHELLCEAYPAIHFIPVRRRFKIVNRVPRSEYDQVPVGSLTYFLDNVGWEKLEDFDAVCTTYDAMPSLANALENSDNRTGSAHRVSSSIGMIAAQCLGLAWRSDLAGYARGRHYTPFSVILDVVGRINKHWIILQADVSMEEAKSLRNAAPGRVHFVDTVDLKNDFNAKAALISQLDIVISPATFLAELSGFIGAPTILTSRSSAVAMRQLDSGRDIWFPSIVHANSPFEGDFSGTGLAELIISRIEQLLVQGESKDHGRSNSTAPR